MTRREHHHLRWRRRNEQQACEGLEMVASGKNNGRGRRRTATAVGGGDIRNLKLEFMI